MIVFKDRDCVVEVRRTERQHHYSFCFIYRNDAFVTDREFEIVSDVDYLRFQQILACAYSLVNEYAQDHEIQWPKFV